MSRGRRISTTDRESVEAAKLTRTTVFLTDILTENLDALSLQTGESKAVLVRQALADFLESRGLQPHRRPKVTVTY
jgi:hypothetical protein